MSATRAEIVAAARGWIGTPWRHQGRVKGLGVDCVGLPIMVAHGLGIPAKDGHMVDPLEYCNYPEDPLDGRVLLVSQKLMVEKQTAPLPGDVICFRFGAIPRHLGIVSDMPATLDRLGIVHVNRMVGRVVEHRLDHKWRRRIAAVFSFAGIS